MLNTVKEKEIEKEKERERQSLYSSDANLQLNFLILLATL